MAVPFYIESGKIGEDVINVEIVGGNYDIPAGKMCRICLRSDIVITGAVDIRLLDFYDELTDVNVFQHPMLSFCPLCEYKLRKFYNFKQRCLRSNFILRTKVNNPGPVNLISLLSLVPRDLGLSTPSDRHGFFDLKCPLLTAERNSMVQTIPQAAPLTVPKSVPQTVPYTIPQTIPQTDIFNNIKNEVMIDTDLIKTEVDKLLEDPITVNQNDVILEMLDVDKSEDETDFDSNDEKERKERKKENAIKNVPIKDVASSKDALKCDKSEDGTDFESNDEEMETPIKNVAIKDNKSNKIALDYEKSEDETDFDSNDEVIENAHEDVEIKDESSNADCDLIEDEVYYEDPRDDDYEYIDENLSDDEMPLSKQKNKKASIKNINTKTKKKNTKVKNKLAMNNLEKTPNINLENFSYSELKIIRQLLPTEQKKQFDFRLEVENFKTHCANLLEEGKIDLGEVMMTKELFLKMFAKCDMNYLKILGVVNQMDNLTKLKKFLLYLNKRFNPEYETIFEINYLYTKEEKIQEFNSRKNNKQYIEAAHKCEKCYLTFTHQTKLEYHNKGHDPNLPYVCEICPMRFIKRSCLKKHQIYHYSVYKCKMCSVYTYYFSGMLNHYNQHKGKLYTCDICLGQYGKQKLDNVQSLTASCFKCVQESISSSRSTLFGHRLTHARLRCEHCARKFNSQHYLDKHMELRHADAPPTSTTVAAPSDAALSCGKCNAVFKSQIFLRRHMIRHDTLFYKCRSYSCGKKFSTASELREHAESSGHFHSRGREKLTSITCLLCNEEVPNIGPNSLYVHHIRKHPTVSYSASKTLLPNAVLCEHCGKAFWHHYLYLDHVNTHTGEKPHQCKDCDAAFSGRRLLYSHRMKVHARLHKCDLCDKTFYNHTGYINHKHVHTGEKPHECKLCGKGFKQASHLRTHMICIHSSNKPAACQLCNKRFKMKSSLRLHMMVHMGQRPHPCKLCDKQFHKLKELKAHVLKFHS